MDDARLQDFRSKGKYDEAGHPVNALVLEGEQFCKQRGQVVPGAFRTDNKKGVSCQGRLPPSPGGEQIVNVRLRPIGIDLGSKKEVVRITAKEGNRPSSVTYTGKSFRADGQWIYVPLHLGGSDPSDLTIETFGRGAIEIDYIEIFADDFTLALGPGTRVFGDDDLVTIESPFDAPTPTLTVNDKDAHLQDLLDGGSATAENTSFRRVYSVKVRFLAGRATGDLDLVVHDAAGEAKARMQVLRAPPPCNFVGDPAGKKVLLTGFQPFPVDSTHENVSDVAVQALDPSRLHGAQVVRLTLPVEYDDAPNIVASAIIRCAPDIVIDFGQGGGEINVEHTAYNLKDTGTAPDNRGRYQAGVPIADDGPAQLSSGLPIAAIDAALDTALAAALPALGRVTHSDSTDPGRYICNDTFYSAVRASTPATRTGFIHLPYRTDFSVEQRVAWGEIVRAIVEAAVGG